MGSSAIALGAATRNALTWRRLLPFFSFGALVVASAQDNATCLECHLDEELTLWRGDKEVSLFVPEDAVARSVHSAWDCIDCHEGYDPDATPHREAPRQVDCLACHEDFDPATHQFHPQLAQATFPFESPETNCVSCHGSHDIKAVKDEAFAFASKRSVESCGACHEEVRSHFVASAHFLADNDTPDCLTCHRVDVVNGDQSPFQLKMAQSQQCMSCHVDRPEAAMWTRLGADFVASWGVSVHGRALEEGNAEAANCVDCHGSHDMKRAMVADSWVNKLHIPDTCQRCHEEAAADYALSAHATALRVGVLEAPVCTDCHGEHLILDHLDPEALVSPRNVSQQLCGECHGSVRLTRRYGISGDRFETFADSYHGLALRGGSVEVVNCASCHGYHQILPSTDPRSSVHPANLAKTCGECHPRANELFAVGKVHVSIAPVGLGTLRQTEGSDLVQLVATLYVILIIVVVGAMFLHNVLDFFKKTRLKIHGHRYGMDETVAMPHRLYLRMSVNERLQHGVLVISFVILVITGFMLSYPEAILVQWMRGISSNLFEWRSLLHRIAGVVMLAAGVWHMTYLAFTVRGRELFRDLLPRQRDLADLFGTVRYNLGMARTKPRFERFSYIEKAEYWALLWGSVLMGITGILLWANELTMGLLTKTGFDISRTIHFYEAILATLAIIVWHFYFVIFNPEVYPMNLSWLTGHLSEEEMAAEHPAELDRIKARENAAQEAPHSSPPAASEAPRPKDAPPPG
jgi:cytochrome b subunit of formate dehydrogenase